MSHERLAYLPLGDATSGGEGLKREDPCEGIGRKGGDTDRARLGEASGEMDDALETWDP